MKKMGFSRGGKRLWRQARGSRIKRMEDVFGIGPGLRYVGLTLLRPSDYVRTAINLLLGLAGVAAFISILIGGLQWIISGGDKERLDRARGRVVHALIGLAVVFSSYALLFIVRALFGIDLIGVELGSIR